MTRADFNANINAAWCVFTLFAAIVLVWKACILIKRNDEWNTSGKPPLATLRIQLAMSLALVLTGIAWTRAISWIFWELRARDTAMPWEPQWVMFGQIGGFISIVGATVAIRALTYEEHGNRVWLLATFCAFVAMVVI